LRCEAYRLSFVYRNARPPTAFFDPPPNQVVELSSAGVSLCSANRRPSVVLDRAAIFSR
jgi:hypothetical protein